MAALLGTYLLPGRQCLCLCPVGEGDTCLSCMPLHQPASQSLTAWLLRAAWTVLSLFICCVERGAHFCNVRQCCLPGECLSSMLYADAWPTSTWYLWR